MGRSMDDIPSVDKDQRWENYVAKWEWDETGSYQLARIYGDVWMDYVHTVETKTGKRYPEYCHGWDVDKCEFYPDRKDRCPCCALEIKGAHRYFMNAIDIEAEENKPQKAKADWSPIRFLSMSQTLFKRLKELTSVNKNVNVANRDAGAIVQIKYNKNAEAANMYSATMDTKCVPITAEQAGYIVTQKYPDGRSDIIRGKEGLPAQFEYIRCMNSRDDMIKSLRRNNFYGESEASASAAHSFDDNRTMTREETVAKLDAETSIETMDLAEDIAKNIFAGNPVDEAPAPKKVAREESPKVKEPYDECPTEYGKFASTLDCFTKCAVHEECRKASEKKTTATSESAPAKKTVAPVIDDDDDEV